MNNNIIFFKEAFKDTLKNEGGIIDLKNDQGQLTYKGISQYYNPKWDGWKIIQEVIKDYNLDDKNDRRIVNSILGKNETLNNKVSKMYFNSFWKKNCSKIKQSNLANSLFDFSVNAGPKRSTKILQKIIYGIYNNINNVFVDGIIGPHTLNKIEDYINKYSEMYLIMTFALKRIEFYIERVTLKPKQKSFLFGWINRVLNTINKSYNLSLYKGLETQDTKDSINILIQINDFVLESKDDFNKKNKIYDKLNEILG